MQTFSNSLRFGLMLLGGLLSVIGSKAIGFPSAGAIGCIVIACMCGLVWKKPKYTRDVSTDWWCLWARPFQINDTLLSTLHCALEQNDVYERLALLWKFVKPISFALIGKEVLFSKIDPKILAYGVVIVVVGSFVSAVRFASRQKSVIILCFFFYLQRFVCLSLTCQRTAPTSTGRSNFTLQFPVFPKQLFRLKPLNWDFGRLLAENVLIISSAFFRPQATLGPVALDMVRQQHLGTYEEEMANNVLITSVLAILITAPLGAILMVNLAPKFLRKSDLPSISS